MGGSRGTGKTRRHESLATAAASEPDLCMTSIERRVLSTTAGRNTEAFSVRDWVLFATVGTIWGSAFMLMDIGLDAFRPELIAWGRLVLGASVLWLFPASRLPIARQDWPRVAVISLVWFAIPFTLFPIAQQYINSATAGMINSSVPIFVAAIGSIMLSRLPRPRQRWGLLIGLAGVLAVGAPAALTGEAQVFGVVVVLVAVVCYGLAINIAAPVQQRYGSITLLAKVLTLAALWTAPLGLLGLADSAFAWPSAVAIVCLGAVGTGIAFALMATLIGRVGATRASFVTYLLPPVALFLGVVFRGDQVSSISVLGVLAVLAGAYLASRRE